MQPTLLPHVQELIEELKLALGAQKENIEMNRQQFQDSMSKMMLGQSAATILWFMLEHLHSLSSIRLHRKSL